MTVRHWIVAGGIALTILADPAPVAALEQTIGPAVASRLPAVPPADTARPGAVATRCPTNGAVDSVPHNIKGAAGLSTIIVIADEMVGVYDRATCAVIASASLETVFAPLSPDPAEFFYEADVTFDEHSDRFLVSSQSSDSANTYVNLAVIDEEDPVTYFTYRVKVFSHADSINCVPEITPNPHFTGFTLFNYAVGYSQDRWYVTGSVGDAGAGAPSASLVVAIEKAPTLTGASVSTVCASLDTYGVVPTRVRTGEATVGLLFLDDQHLFTGRVMGLFVWTESGGNGSPLLDSASAATVLSPATASAGIEGAGLQPNSKHIEALGTSFRPSTQIDGQLWNTLSSLSTITGDQTPVVFKIDAATPSILAEFQLPSISVSGGAAVFAPSLSLASAAPGAPAFLTALRTEFAEPATGNLSVVAWTGPNDTATGWTFDIVEISPDQCAPAGSICLVGQTSTQIDPADHARAWAFGEIFTGPRPDLNWRSVAGLFGGPGESGPTPLAPVATAATGVGQTSFAANWNAADRAAGYRLDVATDAAFTAFVPGFQDRDVGKVLSFAVTGLDPGTAYFFRVRARNFAGTSASSNEIPLATAALAGPNPLAEPPQCALSLDPPEVTAGDEAELRWSSVDATAGVVDNEIGAVSPVEAGGTAVSPNATTTYRATFTGPGGAVNCEATLAVSARVGGFDPLALLLFGMLGASGLLTRRRGA